ncbi:MFS transporter [Streptomyces montanisoli]|uniref:MFS transporter n=1 Tax=Streptomyces montanisoli TaxID=2798581 RepID=A0A940MDV2_9ACTN|nr:MFS transporter [Streptomyces montanisoli]MBP0459073.1 MFS transporter [Streptomyces montanisoli]
MSTASAAALKPEGTAAPHRGRILAMLGLAQLMVVLDTTIVNIALPSAQADLGFSDGSRQWIITAYALAFAALLLLGGRLADLFGRKPAFLIGAGGFAIASALGGLAPSFTVLVTARALQGIFAALLAPAILSLLNTTFTEPRERAKAFGVFGAIGASGTVLGLLIGGTLTQFLDWRWTMFINVAFAAVVTVSGTRLLAHTRDKADSRLDLPGTVAISTGLFALVYGFSNAESHSWSSPLTWGFLAAGVVLITVFALWQRRSKDPLLPLSVLRDRDRAAAFAALLLTGAGLFGVLLFLTYYLQINRGFSPVTTGLAFLPMILAMMSVAQVSTTKLLPALGAKRVLPAGFAVSGAGLLWLTTITLTSNYWVHVLPPLVVIGAGLGAIVPPAMSLATQHVPAEDAGVASATVNVMQQVGGSIGTALLNTLAAGAAASYLVGKNATDAAVQGQAALHSYTTAFAWASGLFFAGTLITALLHRRRASATPAR